MNISIMLTTVVVSLVVASYSATSEATPAVASWEGSFSEEIQPSNDSATIYSEAFLKGFFSESALRDSDSASYEDLIKMASGGDIDAGDLSKYLDSQGVLDLDEMFELIDFEDIQGDKTELIIIDGGLSSWSVGAELFQYAPASFKTGQKSNLNTLNGILSINPM